MKKFIFSMVILCCIMLLNAQTIVTTVPQCKNAILEEYTGIHCGYCPDGHRIAELINAEYPKQVVLINIHQGSFANPGTGEPDFRTIYGDSLAAQAGVTGYPSGTINRHLFPKLSATSTGLSRNAWFTAASEIIGIQSPVNVGFTSQFDTSTRELTVNVEAYYTQNSPFPYNLLNVVLLENHVIGYQSDYANGTHLDYDHKHIMRHLITGQWGDKINTTTKGTLFQKTYKYTVPAKYMIENCDLVVYVAESHQEIYTGVQAPAVNGSNNGEGITFIGELNNTGKDFQKGQSAQVSTFSITAQSAFISAEDFVFKLTSNAPSGWTGTFTVDGNPYTDTAVINIAASGTKNITITATPGSTAGLATYTLTMRSAANPTANIKKYQVYVVSGISDLIVNNDASWGNGGDTTASNYQQVFKDGLQTAGISSYASCDLSVFEKGYSSLALDGVKNLYYNVGWSFPSLTDSNVAKFQSFLDKGGNLLISGQDIGWENFNTSNTSYATPNTKAFVSNYLNAGWTDDGSTTQTQLTEIPGESVFNATGSSTLLNVYGNNPADEKPFFYPDIVYAVHNGQPIFYYNGDKTKVAGIRSNSGVYKTVYLAVSLEMIESATVRNKIMKLANDWFNGKIQSIEFDDAMQQLMGQGYPNPATNTFTIPLKNINTDMTLVITDINGREISNQQVKRGSDRISIDCSPISEGMYIAKLYSERGFAGTSRFVIVK